MALDYPFALHVFLVILAVFRVLFAWYLPVPTVRIVRVHRFMAHRFRAAADYRLNQISSDAAFLLFFWIPAVSGTIVRLSSTPATAQRSFFWVSALAAVCLVPAVIWRDRTASAMKAYNLALPQVTRTTGQSLV